LVHGPCGWGECSPLGGYPCSLSSALASAVESATVPWPEPVRQTVAVNALVTGPSFDPLKLAGFPCVKVKVGRRDLQRDLALVSAVRDAVGPSVALRIDANGSWDEEIAERMLRRMAHLELEMAEQPVEDIDALSRLRRRVQVPLAADECVRSVDDAKRLRRLGSADALVVKLQPLGGVSRALRVAEAAGLPVIVSSMMETSVGLAASLNLAASLPELPFACGLATADAREEDVTHEPLGATDGRMAVRRVVPDGDLLTKFSESDRRYGAEP
jgi:o-succinylbenzoate synthase